MVGVAQLVERRSVAPNVAGSIPVSHPNFHFHFVFLKDTICSEQSHLFRRRLGNEHPVKRVPVMIRQRIQGQPAEMSNIQSL